MLSVNGRMQKHLKNTHALILAGGSGTRLHSLTQWHSKPSIPIGGKFRTIDFSMSNCINSGIRRISLLTQYKSHSLNAHIQKGWSFLCPELGEFVQLLPAQQRVKDCWYQGTADAVYQNLDIISDQGAEYILILAGDHLYKMNYAAMLEQHIQSGADVSVGCVEVPVEQARAFGVMAVDEEMRVTQFVEKPAKPAPLPGKPGVSLASMGIYVFNRRFLHEVLVRDALVETSKHDFGSNILPNIVRHHRVLAYPFTQDATGNVAYWRDVGTIDSYYQANMDLIAVTPELDLYDSQWPIWTYQEQLPPAKFVFNDDDRRGYAVDSLVSAGCVVSGGRVEHSVLFNNVRVNSFSQIQDAVILPNVEIGRHCRLRKVIIDQNCHVPEDMEIGFDPTEDAKHFQVSPEGVVLVSAQMLAQRALDKVLCA